MATFIGVDWASHGWVAARLDAEDETTVEFHPTIWNLWHERGDDAYRILVDVPIGLPERNRRACDEEARECIGDRRNSVFWTPIREAAYEDNIVDAKAVQEDRTGWSISNQTWAIVPRIREVDTFLRTTDAARGVVRESHPEVCFAALSDRAMAAPKSDGEGVDARRRMLCDELDLDGRDLDETIRPLTDPNYAARAAPNDVLDAMVLAVTARSIPDGEYATLPDDPPTDAEGLPMEVVYPDL